MATPGRILVIDDHPHLLEILTYFLRAQGHEIRLCVDGRSGIERLKEETFDLVVTDLRLPDMPGWDVVRYAKTRSPSTPVALMTGSGDVIDRKDVERLRIEYLLSKPFTRQQFMTVVASALGQAA